MPEYRTCTSITARSRPIDPPRRMQQRPGKPRPHQGHGSFPHHPPSPSRSPHAPSIISSRPRSRPRNLYIPRQLGTGNPPIYFNSFPFRTRVSVSARAHTRSIASFDPTSQQPAPDAHNHNGRPNRLPPSPEPSALVRHHSSS